MNSTNDSVRGATPPLRPLRPAPKLVAVWRAGQMTGRPVLAWQRVATVAADAPAVDRLSKLLEAHARVRGRMGLPRPVVAGG